MLRGHSQLCTQELLLLVLGGPYAMSAIKPRLEACKAIALQTVFHSDPIIIFYMLANIFSHILLILLGNFVVEECESHYTHIEPTTQLGCWTTVLYMVH